MDLPQFKVMLRIYNEQIQTKAAYKGFANWHTQSQGFNAETMNLIFSRFAQQGDDAIANFVGLWL